MATPEKTLEPPSEEGSIASRTELPEELKNIRIYCGTFVHATRSSALEVMQNQAVLVKGSQIICIQSAAKLEELLEEYGLMEYEEEAVYTARNTDFFMPGFVDANAHATPYVSLGLEVKRSGKNCLTDLSSKNPQRNLQDDRHAAEVFRKLIRRSLKNGTTCAAYNGSTMESAARILLAAIASVKQRAMVGLDIDCSNKREDTHLLQIEKAKDFVHVVLRKKSDLIKPTFISSRPLPEWIEQKLAAVRSQYNIPYQTYEGDIPPEILTQCLEHWVDFGGSTCTYHARNDLLNDKTILSHCIYSSNADIETIKEANASVVHCPNSRNLGVQCPIYRYLDKGIKVGLGTDISRGRHVSMLDTIRQCVYLSKQKYFAKQKKKLDINTKPLSDHNEMVGKEEEGENLDAKTLWEDEDWADFRQVSYQEAFRLATLGSATVLGLDDKIGNFEVGKEFDALVIRPEAEDSPLDVFTGDTFEEVLQKFLFLGDDRNIRRVYVAGNRIV